MRNRNLPIIFMLLTVILSLCFAFEGQSFTYKNKQIWLNPNGNYWDHEKAWFVADTNDYSGGSIRSYAVGEFAMDNDVYITEEGNRDSQGQAGYADLHTANFLIVVNDGSSYEDWQLNFVRYYYYSSYNSYGTYEFGDDSNDYIWIVWELDTLNDYTLKMMAGKKHSGSYDLVYNSGCTTWTSTQATTLDGYLDDYYYYAAPSLNMQEFEDLANWYSFPDTCYN